MFNASLQETLARYSDASRNPYADVLQSQLHRHHTPPELRSLQHLAQPLHPRLDASFDVPPANQHWRPRLKLDIEALEPRAGSTLQILDSRGCYIQSLISRTHSQPCMQQVLPEHPDFVTSSRSPRLGLGTVRAGPTRRATNHVTPTRRTANHVTPTRRTANHVTPTLRAAKVIERKGFVSDVAPRLWSFEDATNVPLASTSTMQPSASGSCSGANRQSDISSSDDATGVLLAPASTIQPSASGSYANPIIISDTQPFPEMSSPANMGNASTEREHTIQQVVVERRDAEMTETEKREPAIRATERTETERDESAAKKAERTGTGQESATLKEAEKTETERRESTTRQAERTKTKSHELGTMEAERTETERCESAANEATTEKDSCASAAANTPKLLRMDRKLNNQDLFMGWYKSESSSLLRYPHDCIAPNLGDVYVHCVRKERDRKFQLWVRQINRGMTIWVKAHIFHMHPKLLDRRLTLSAIGEPYWATRTSLMASGGRERAVKIAEMIIYN